MVFGCFKHTCLYSIIIKHIISLSYWLLTLNRVRIVQSTPAIVHFSLQCDIFNFGRYFCTVLSRFVIKLDFSYKCRLFLLVFISNNWKSNRNQRRKQKKNSRNVCGLLLHEWVMAFNRFSMYWNINKSNEKQKEKKKPEIVGLPSNSYLNQSKDARINTKYQLFFLAFFKLC